MARSKASLPAQCVGCPQRTSDFCGALFSACLESSSLKKLNQRFAIIRAGQQILHPSTSNDDVLILCAGWAYRYHQLSGGGRQILRFLLPGDPVSPSAIFAKGLSFSLKALTDVQVSRLASDEIRKRCLSNEALMLAVFNSMIDNDQDAYQLLTAIGRRPAEARIAYLLLSLMRRIALRSIIAEHRYPFPLRQQHIGDAVGLTPVHVSRVLAQLRERGILTLSEGTLQVTDLPELERMGSLT